MKILSYIAIVLALLLAGYANAATSFTFSPATDGTYVCPSYCLGFTTSDPAHSIEYINVQAGPLVLIGGVYTNTYALTLGIDGSVYHATSYGSGQAFSAPGLMASVNWATSRTCTGSGKGQHCTNRYHANTGSLAL